MESQGNGKGAISFYAGTGSKGRASRLLNEAWRRAITSLLLCAAIGWLGVAHATNYVYDANGRLVAVTQSTGTSAQYTYDAVGNLVGISSIAANQLAVFAIVPTHGNVGTQVVIEGQGFSATLANDSVAFNGSPAIVESASSTQLVTSVPAGATTGPISVTVGTQTATSSAPFVVGDAGTPPVITQVTPTIVAAGSVVTVSGSGFAPVAGETNVYLGTSPQSPSSLSDTQLQFSVSTTASSGHVTVQTPYGDAVSAPLLVLPSGFTASNVTSSTFTAINGAVENLSIGSTGQTAAMMFDAPGGWLSIQASNLSPTSASLSYSVYGPGNALVAQGTVSASNPSIHLPQLPQRGTYAVFFTSTTGSVQFSASVVADAFVANAAATLATTVPGQTARLLFNGTASQALNFVILGSTTSPANDAVQYTFYTPTGSVFTNQYLETGVVTLANLQSTGTYQVIVSPGSGATATAQVQVVPVVASTLVPSGGSQSLSSGTPGVGVYMSFVASQGQNLELTLNNLSVVGSSATYAQVNVTNSSGTNVASFTCSTTNPNGSCMRQLWNLATGSYTVVVTPPSSSSTISFNAMLQPDVVGPNLTIGNNATVTLSAGQEERFTFNATHGDTLALNLSGVTSTPSGSPVTVSVYRPDVGPISTGTSGYASFSTSSSQILNLPSLPVDGTYTVIVSSPYGLASGFQIGLASGITGTLTPGSTSQQFVSSLSSENIYLSFSASGGNNLELTLNNVNVTSHLVVYVYNQQGVEVATFTCYPTNPAASCTQHLWDLAEGTYSVVVSPTSGGTMSFNALLEPDVVGATLTVGTSASIALSAGQVERFTFSANAYDKVVLSLTGVATTPTGNSAATSVYLPGVDVGSITSTTSPLTTFTTSSSTTTNPLVIPVTGTYTVIVAPIDGLPLNATLKEVSDTAGTGPTWGSTNLPTNGQATNFSTASTGQSVTMTFNVTSPGEALDLTLSNLVMTGSSNYVQLTIAPTGGTTISENWCYTTTNPSCMTPLWNLPVGSYTVTASPGAATASFTATLGAVSVGPSIAVNTPTTVTLATGQAEQVTFNANAGETVSLAVSVTSEAIANTGMQVYVFRPDTGALSTGNYYAVMATPGSSPNSYTLDLPNLPVTGAYRLVLLGGNGIALTSQVEVLNVAEGSVTANASAQSFSSSVANQNVYFSFSASRGENVELELSNISVSGTSSNYVIANVTNQVGVNVASVKCYTGWSSFTGSLASCTTPLWNLGAGVYTVTVSPPDANTVMSFNAQLQDDVVGPSLQANTTSTVTLASGQVERLTFSGVAGQPINLQLNGATNTPPGNSVFVKVYEPGVGEITTSDAYALLFDPGTTLLYLPYLPTSGTYTLVAYTICSSCVLNFSGDPATAQLTLIAPSAQSLPANGVAQSYTSPSGQFAYLSFSTAQTGDFVLSLSNLAVAGSTGAEVQIVVIGPGGQTITSGTCLSSQMANCVFELSNLQTGTYEVLVEPPVGSGVVSFGAMLQPASAN